MAQEVEERRLRVRDGCITMLFLMAALLTIIPGLVGLYNQNERWPWFLLIVGSIFIVGFVYYNYFKHASNYSSHGLLNTPDLDVLKTLDSLNISETRLSSIPTERDIAISHLDEDLAQFRMKYDRKKQGQRNAGWVHEDLVYLITTFKNAISNYSPETSHFRADALLAEQKYRDGVTDTKQFMLALEGITRRLRDEWESGRI